MPSINRGSETSQQSADAPESVDDRVIVARIREGDAKAFDAMVVEYYEKLLGLAFIYLRERQSAEEVVQDVFLAIWQHRTRWAPDTSLRLYLYAATRNRAFSRLRHRRLEDRFSRDAAANEDVLSFSSSREDADTGQRTAELSAAIESAIESLPPRMREAFVLSRQAHLTHEEIARVMGTSMKTVQEQIGRALKNLRLALADWLE
jgi:RNA polymerase sigma-70 factor (ECF subfamily)